METQNLVMGGAGRAPVAARVGLRAHAPRWQGAHGNGLCHSPEIPVCLASPGNLHQQLRDKVLTAAMLACHFRLKQVTTYPPHLGLVTRANRQPHSRESVTKVNHSGVADGQVPPLQEKVVCPPNRTQVPVSHLLCVLMCICVGLVLGEHL